MKTNDGACVPEIVRRNGLLAGSGFQFCNYTGWKLRRDYGKRFGEGFCG